VRVVHSLAALEDEALVVLLRLAPILRGQNS